MESPVPPLHARVSAVLVPLGAAIGAAGCLLPWEQLSVLGGTGDQTTSINALHGSGIAACAGCMLALLVCAQYLWSGRWRPLSDATIILSGTLIAAGAALYTIVGGYAPRQGEGFSVRFGPGFFTCAASGVLLTVTGLVRLLSAPLQRSRQP